MRKGIDISAWQGAIDLARAGEEGFDFVIIKGGGGDDGLYTDSKFARNYSLAKSLGMAVGAYWFSRALTVEEAKAEADYFYAHCLKGRQFELPIYIDVENKKQLAVGKRLLTDIIHAFCRRLEELGFYVGIYSSQSYFCSYMYDDELQRYAHWVACWAKDCDYPGDSFGLWQYGGEVNVLRTNRVAGVVCDQDYLLTDYTPIIKDAGLNGFGEADAVHTPKAQEYTIDAFVRDVQAACGAEVDGIAGMETISKTVTISYRINDYHPAVRAVQRRLEALGYNVGEIDGEAGNLFDAAVRAFQEDNGCVVDGELTRNMKTWRKLLGME